MMNHKQAKAESSASRGTAAGGITREATVQPHHRSYNHAKKEAWMWRGVKGREAITTVDLSTLEPLNTQVSSESGLELVCSYNWQDCEEATIQVPGHAPVWQDLPLPMTIPMDSENGFVDQNAARVPEYSFEPLFRATASMNPHIRFDDVDIVVNRNSLRKLLDICSGHRGESFRVNLLLINDTLFIERCEKNARKMIWGSQNSGWGRNFEKTSTKYPAGIGSSTSHHRVLRYHLGDLNCVVRFEVDACYRRDSGDGMAAESAAQVKGDEGKDDLASGLGHLALQDAEKSKAVKVQATEVDGKTIVMPQSTAAEIKAKARSQRLSYYLPQLWFGRTPWLLVGHHNKGNFNKVEVTKAEDHFADWETRNQVQLRKVALVLAKLREAVQASGEKNCVAIYDRDESPRGIRVFAATKSRNALPDDLIRDFWVAGKS